ncbi:uncharacterized protein LOC110842184 isoform X2 [Folsomia candida]|uniref:uncharacterized protein LOC110842184 isoform X2 n=2 Tax=Folsomia candida TaxID=158441 RepID=UPI001604DA2C|nr:uncharacterized protein LOC110842184 isoform X2 [Folsomia candida]
MEQILRDTGLEQYTDKLKENDVDDLLFFKLLDGAAGSTEERLFAEIIPSVGHRLKIITAARELGKQTSETCQRAPNGNMNIMLGDDNSVNCGQEPDKEEHVEITFVTFNPLFDIKQIILNSDEDKGTANGMNVLEEISRSSLLTSDTKTLIKRRIVNFLVKNYSYHPSKEVKENLAKCVAMQLFQNLNCEQQKNIENMFYRKSEVKEKTKKKNSASGLIEDRLKHLRRKRNVTKPRKPESCLEITKPSEDEEDKKSWLRYTSSPLNQVAEYMAQTFRLRSEELKTNDLLTTLNEWPRLIDTTGMIDLDFSIRYPDKGDMMLHKWTCISNQIWKYAVKTRANIHGEIGISKNVEEWSKDEINSGSLLLLPYLFSKSAYTQDGKKRRRITGAHSPEFFVQFFQRNEDLEEFRLAESVRTQPFVICIGNLKFLDIQQAFVMVERRLIAAESFVKAVDLCFKIFYVLELKFPEECKSVWEFFDCTVFQTNKVRSSSSSVLSLSSQITMDEGLNED